MLRIFGGLECKHMQTDCKTCQKEQVKDIKMPQKAGIPHRHRFVSGNDDNDGTEVCKSWPPQLSSPVWAQPADRLTLDLK